MIKHIIFKNKCQHSNRKMFRLISLLCAIFLFASSCAFIIYKLSQDKSYRIKWQDYDDCGIA